VEHNKLQCTRSYGLIGAPLAMALAGLTRAIMVSIRVPKLTPKSIDWFYLALSILVVLSAFELIRTVK
jgi:hypothetical protein